MVKLTLNLSEIAFTTCISIMWMTSHVHKLYPYQPAPERITCLIILLIWYTHDFEFNAVTKLIRHQQPQYISNIVDFVVRINKRDHLNKNNNNEKETQAQ